MLQMGDVMDPGVVDGRLDLDLANSVAASIFG